MPVHKKHTSTIPVRCIERHPTTQTVWFAGRAINLGKVASSYVPPLTVAMLSMVFNGRRNPSVAYARKVAFALGMQLEAFLDELEKVRQ